MMPPITRPSVIINVEDYPGLDPATGEGKEQSSAIGFAASRDNPGKCHFRFKHKGEQIGQMITRNVFEVVDGKLRETVPN
jgi:hypothetical protein